MVGVTGTNGKTSCAHWIAAALRGLRAARGILGTLGNGLVGALAPRTQHHARRRVLHELLAQLRRAGAQAVAMEVSSHGLDQGRVNGVNVRRRAVHQPHARPPRLSRDDGGVRRREGAALQLAGPAHRGHQRRRRVRPAASSTRRVARGQRRRHLRPRGRPTSARRRLAIEPAGTGAIRRDAVGKRRSRDAGRRRLQCRRTSSACSACCSRATCRSRQRSPRSADLVPPAGRMQRLGGDDAPLVVVDYAHTPDALEKALDGAASRRACRTASSCACSAAAATATAASGREMGASRRTLADRVVRDQRQSAQRGSAGDRARDRRRASARPATGADRVELDRARGDRRRDASERRPATSCWSPARATRPTRKRRACGIRSPTLAAAREALLAAGASHDGHASGCRAPCTAAPSAPTCDFHARHDRHARACSPAICSSR